ncbi:hypothetical protein LCGC14_1853610, partial [marine sediment metagenome]
ILVPFACHAVAPGEGGWRSRCSRQTTFLVFGMFVSWCPAFAGGYGVARVGVSLS